MTKIWMLTLVFVCSVATAQTQYLENGFDGPGAPRDFPVSVINQEESEKLFQTFAQNKNIPFKYLVDGCYARAYEMNRIAENANIIMGKIYVEGVLQAKTNSEAIPIAKWDRHIAPVAFVEISGGKVELMVFDPSLFAKPVSVEEWKQKMLFSPDRGKLDPIFNMLFPLPSIRTAYFGNRFQLLHRSAETYKDRWDLKDLELAKDALKTYSQ